MFLYLQFIILLPRTKGYSELHSTSWTQLNKVLFYIHFRVVFIKVKFTYIKFSHIKVNNSVAFQIFTILFNHHSYQVPKYVYFPIKNLVPNYLEAGINLLSVSMNLSILYISCNMWYFLSGFFHWIPLWVSFLFMAE